MTDLISEIQRQEENNRQDNLDDSEEEDDVETHTREDIEDFEAWAVTQANKDLEKFKDLTDLTDLPDATQLRDNISSLNQQQRRIFDDFTERVIAEESEESPFFLFISGSAGSFSIIETYFQLSS